ncbi:unnamed protein product [Mesocestoides corti]|uniref:C2 domain-containing protein n=1 Tax=Mesocestoides corti TaxID=53468 RepID=A0A3P6H0Y4_MESCO|nr:unnamed protein product [Mesocestoides corti]
MIPPEVLQQRITEQNSEQSFEALRLKVQKADEERRRKEEMDRLIAERQGRLQDHGYDDELGFLVFKLLYGATRCIISLYDVNREAMKVTLVEANHLRPRDPLGVILNVRVSVTLESVRDPSKIIKPQPKLSLLNKLAANRGIEYQGKGGWKYPSKTNTVDAASSSIYWRIRKPVWNEDFIFEKIKNRQLKHLAVVFTVYERQVPKPPEPPKEDFIGEVRIPLIKIHKKLATNDDRSGDARSMPQVAENTNETADEGEDPGVNQQVVEIPLPSENRLGDKEAVIQWLETVSSPTPGQDEEMEELASPESLCNSEAVRDQLGDPELMDSISVRELRMANADTNLDTIKQLAMPPPSNDPAQAGDADYWPPSILLPRTQEENQNRTEEDSEQADSEPDLPENERPRVIRTLEGWHYINSVPRLRPVYGELEIGLLYDPSLGKLTISIIKGRKMVAPDGTFMKVWISVQQKTRICKKRTPFVAVTSAKASAKSGSSHNEPVAIIEKAGKIHKTSVRIDTADPVWDDRFHFNVAKEQLQNVFFDTLVYNQDSVIGGLRLGHFACYKASYHWNTMIKRPGVWVEQTYILQ